MLPRVGPVGLGTRSACSLPPLSPTAALLSTHLHSCVMNTGARECKLQQQRSGSGPGSGRSRGTRLRAASVRERLCLCVCVCVCVAAGVGRHQYGLLSDGARRKCAFWCLAFCPLAQGGAASNTTAQAIAQASAQCEWVLLVYSVRRAISRSRRVPSSRHQNATPPLPTEPPPFQPPPLPAPTTLRPPHAPTPAPIAPPSLPPSLPPSHTASGNTANALANALAQASAQGNAAAVGQTLAQAAGQSGAAANAVSNAIAQVSLNSAKLVQREEGSAPCPVLWMCRMCVYGSSCVLVFSWVCAN